MNYKELKNSKEYNLSKIQIDLFNEVEKYRIKNNLSTKELADHLEVPRIYMKHLNGDFDGSLSLLVDLCLRMGLVPEISFKEIEQ